MGDEDEGPARKVLILNAGEYLGANLSKRFATSEDAKFEVLGTLKPGATKPHAVKRVVEATPDALRAAVMECELVVLDCLGNMDGAEALLESISGVKEFEDEKVLVGVSSVMTWTRTSPDAEEPEKALTEEEYKRRRPHSNFKELLALEKLVTKSKRTGLRTHVVAAGLTYGMEEDLFHDLFRAAWSSAPLPLASLTDGSNLLPTIHVSDLCSVVLKLLESDPALPYLLAVDQGQAQETPQTHKAVIEALSAALGVGAVEPMTPEQVRLQKDYEFLQAGIKLEGAAVEAMGLEWHSQEGLLANMAKVVYEYREARGLLPLRVLVHGNDDLAKTELAAALAAEYKVPHVVASEAVAAAAAGEDELAAELKAAGDAPPDALVAKALAAALSTTACKNQGYLLQGFPETAEQAALVFGGSVGGEGGEEAAEEEGEEGGGAAAKPGAPELVLILEADDEVIKQKMLAQVNDAPPPSSHPPHTNLLLPLPSPTRSHALPTPLPPHTPRARTPPPHFPPLTPSALPPLLAADDAHDDGGGPRREARRVRDQQRRGLADVGARAPRARQPRGAQPERRRGDAARDARGQGARLPRRAAQLRADRRGALRQGAAARGGGAQGGRGGGGGRAGARRRGGGREGAARGARRQAAGGAAAARARASRGSLDPAAQLPDAERHPDADGGPHRGVQAQARGPGRLPRRVALQEQPRRGRQLRAVRRSSVLAGGGGPTRAVAPRCRRARVGGLGLRALGG